jgi:hypothetical protein
MRPVGLGRTASRFENPQQAGPVGAHDYRTESTIARLPPRSALSERVGGEGGIPFFRFHKDARPLLGFSGTIGNWNNRSMVRLLHPLYEQSAAKPGETLLLAKEGYAVGGLNAVGDDYCWAIQVIFCRLQGDKLDLNDTYTSPWVSDPRNDAVRRLGMTGEPVLGIFGRQGLNNDALGLILTLPASAPVGAEAKVILKKDEAFAGTEPADRALNGPTKSYAVQLRAGQIINIVASAQMPLHVRLSNEQGQCVAADPHRNTKTRVYNFCVPRDGNYQVNLASLIRNRPGPFTLAVTEGAMRPDAP